MAAALIWCTPTEPREGTLDSNLIDANAIDGVDDVTPSLDAVVSADGPEGDADVQAVDVAAVGPSLQEVLAGLPDDDLEGELAGLAEELEPFLRDLYTPTADEDPRVVARLDGGWRVRDEGCDGDDGLALGWADPGFDDADFEVHSLPWVGEVCRPWLRRVVSVPPIPEGGTVLLRFPRVAPRASVWIDGELVTADTGPGPIDLDITKRVATDSAFTLVVRVDNRLDPLALNGPEVGPRPSPYAAYGMQHVLSQPGGLPRAPEVVVLGDVYFRGSPPEPGGTRGLVLVPDPDSGRVGVGVAVVNASSSEQSVTLRVSVHPRNFEGEVSSVALPLVVGPGQTVDNGSIPVSIAQPRLWTPSAPYLYDVHAVVEDPDSGKVLDAVDGVFGLRSAAFGDTGVLRLNGQDTFVRGAALTSPWHSALPSDAVSALLLLKAAGLNAVVASDESVLGAADALGVLVLHAPPFWGAPAEWYGGSSPVDVPSADLVAMDVLREAAAQAIQRARNHPSVVAWIAADSLPLGSAQRESALLALSSEVGAVDPSRGVIPAARTSWIACPWGGVTTDASEAGESLGRWEEATSLWGTAHAPIAPGNGIWGETHKALVFGVGSGPALPSSDTLAKWANEGQVTLPDDGEPFQLDSALHFEEVFLAESAASELSPAEAAQRVRWRAGRALDLQALAGVLGRSPAELPSWTLNEWIERTQAAQAARMEYDVDALRRRADVAGFVTAPLLRTGPGSSWSALVEQGPDGAPLLAYDALRRAARPIRVDVVTRPPKDSWGEGTVCLEPLRVFVHNDVPQPLTASLEAFVFDTAQESSPRLHFEETLVIPKGGRVLRELEGGSVYAKAYVVALLRNATTGQLLDHDLAVGAPCN